MANEIVLTIPEDYRAWQAAALNGMRDNRLAIIVAHRRAGKTEAVCARLLYAAVSIKRSHPTPLYAYIAPFLNQAKSVAWDRLKYYARQMPNTKINESELTLTMFNGAVIRIFGADYPDRLRGLGFDGVVMDEVAQMKPDTWGAVVRPALADRKGWAVFIGTPKGQNVFYDLYQEALRNPDKWFCGMYRADETGVLPQSELDILREEMGDALFRQEFLCDFTAANVNSFIDFDAVEAAAAREKPPVNPAPLVFGLDPARFGDDRTVLIARRGVAIENLLTWRGLDLMAVAEKTAGFINQDKPQAVFVDSVGLGAGVVDRLRQLGHRIMAVNSGTRASKAELYVNLKAEMWAKMKEWLQDGGAIPNDNSLKADLLAPFYDFDSAGRLKIESKDDLKGRGLLSPDCADALALTFAQAVPAADIRFTHRPEFAEV